MINAVLVLVLWATPSFAQNTPPPPVGEMPNPAATPGGGSGSQMGSPLIHRDESILEGVMEPFDYDPRSRRDPFIQPIPDRPVSQGVLHGPLLPLQKFSIDQLRLTGIIWDVHRPKAMLKDPSGGIHIVGPNTKIGPRNGYIAVIREGEIVVVETEDQDGRLVSVAQVMKIGR